MVASIKNQRWPSIMPPDLRLSRFGHRCILTTHWIKRYSLGMKKMRRTLIVLIALSWIIGCRSPEPTTTHDPDTLIRPLQSDLIPKIGVKYQLVIPPEIYRTREPGPKGRESEKAWRLGNEFVFRTALRKGVMMPAIGVIHVTNHVFLVRFLTSKGKDAGLLFVHTSSNIAEISE
ncbi:MAG: hypothetical protein ABIH24_01365 [Verrucomicrobiota bacterium]